MAGMEPLRSLATAIAATFMVAVGVAPLSGQETHDRHHPQGKELDPPRLLHLTTPAGLPVLVVRESVIYFTADPIRPGCTLVMTFYGSIDVRETPDEIEGTWVAD